MAVVLSGDGYLGSEMHGDSLLVLSFLVFAEILQVVKPFVLCQDTKVGGDVVFAVGCVEARELVGGVVREMVVVASKIDGSMLQHGEMLMLDHSAHERFGRVFCRVVLTLVAHSSCAFYLLIDAHLAWLLFPDFV